MLPLKHLEINARTARSVTESMLPIVLVLLSVMVLTILLERQLKSSLLEAEGFAFRPRSKVNVLIKPRKRHFLLVRRKVNFSPI